MKTPNIPFAAATLALALAGACPIAYAADAGSPSADAPAPSAPATGPYNQGTTADGKTIVAPGTYGPFQTPTCEAGPACTAAAAAGDLAATEGPLMDIGRQQMMEAVKKDEDAMVKNGTYQSIERSPDGKGAVITLPNGMIAYSDYVKGFDTMPKKPEDILKDPNAPAAMKAAAQKIVDANDPDKQQLAASEAKMFGGKSGGGFGIKSVPTGGGPGGLTDAGAKTGGDQASADTPGGDSSKGGADGAQADQNDGADISGMGGMIASAGNGNGSSGPGGSSDRTRADNQRAMQSVTDQAVETAGDAEKAAAGLTYTRLADFARHSRALEDLRNTKVQSSNGTDTANDGVDGNDKAARGTGFFGR